MSEGLKIVTLIAVSALLGLLWYFLFFSDEDDEGTYVYWDATVILVWIDASTQEKDYGVGRGRYEVRLTNGKHVEARMYLDEKLERFDCVVVRQRLKLLSYAPTYEIVKRANECWQPT